MEKHKLDLIPTLSGVYLFKNLANEVIYIGKAKSLRKRVSSYFKKNRDPRLDALVAEVADISIITTKNETEALLLEASLIKEKQPRFNILLKDGQPFVYLLFTSEKLEIARNKKKKGVYFGPFLHKTDVRRVYAYLLRTFRLKWCNKKIDGGCLDYHLEICAGNCTGTLNHNDYLFRLGLAQEALTGNKKEFVARVKDKIEQHNKELAFEKSRNLQDYLAHFEVIFQTLQTHFSEKKYAKDAVIATTPTSYTPVINRELAVELQNFLGLEKPIYSIDCFDISHFQSHQLVGSCVRFTDGVPDKNKFRRFKIKSLTTQNDYAALQEIVTRRYRLHGDMPDLLLIDGGKGQLNAVQDIYPEVPAISLAKREETIFSENFPHGIKLDVKTNVGKLLIALRDYAHHFAITYHRLRRKKEQGNEQ
jgi:excinuclease ABC subunit C